MQLLNRWVAAISVGMLMTTGVMAAPPRLAPEPLVAEPLPIEESDQATPAPLTVDTDEAAEQAAPAPATTAPVIAGTGDNRAVFQLLEQLRQMQNEISALRELAEQQEHQMTLLTKRQRSLYQDIDRRLLELEAGGRGIGASSSSTALINTPVSDPAAGGSGISAPGPGTGTAESQMSEKEAYTRAFNVLKEGNYTRAITVFREFLQAYPDGKYADNAQYWLGEAIYATRDYKSALQEFEKILSNYPESPKRKDAELKIGFTYYELKNWPAARASLESVVKNYPGTTNARTAQQRLDRLTREGR